MRVPGKTAAILLTAVCVMSACGGKAEETSSAEITIAVMTEETSAMVETTVETTVENSETEESAEVKTITGEVLDGAMNTIIIKTEDGTELIFSKEDAETDLEDGLVIGSFVVIEYTGEINGEDTTDTRVLKISDQVE